jgi:hypothetical protein
VQESKSGQKLSTIVAIAVCPTKEYSQERVAAIRDELGKMPAYKVLPVINFFIFERNITKDFPVVFNSKDLIHQLLSIGKTLGNSGVITKYSMIWYPITFLKYRKLLTHVTQAHSF